MIASVGIIFLTVTSQLAAASCRQRPLQTRIDFRRLYGKWVQSYYLGDHFDSASCIEHYIHDVNRAKKTLTMDVTATAINSDGVSETRTLKKVANWGAGNSQGINIKNQIATDYRSYLIMYNCIQGVPIVDVEIRDGMQELPANKIREISDILDRVGVSYFDLTKRDQPGCIEDDFLAAK